MKWAWLFILIPSKILAFETSYADSMFRVASSKPNEEGLIFMLDNFYSVFNKNYDDGIEWSELSLTYAKGSSNQQLIGRANMSLGVVWYLKGDYEKCIEYYQTALDIFESIQDSQYIGRVCNEMSVYYRKQQQYDKGLELLDRSFLECSSCGDMVCVETSINNRGVIYEMMGDYDNAIDHYYKALEVAHENENLIGQSYIYSNIAECYRLQEKYDSSLYYLDLSTQIRESLDDTQGIAINYANSGELLLLMGRMDDAKKDLNQALNLAKEVKFLDLERHILKLYFELYKKEGKTDIAIEYLDKSLLIKDSILNVEKIKSLSEMEVRYETEKVEREYAQEQQLRAEADLKAANRTNWIIGISGASIAAIFIGLFVYQRRLRQVEDEKNRAVLEEKQKGLEAVFDATEEERQRIAKDLHDGVGQQMSGLKLAWDNLSVELSHKDEAASNKLGELSEILNETAAEVREISHRMMPKVLSEFGLIPALNEMLDKTLKFSNIQYEFEHFNLSERYESRVEISLYRICQELINNVIKHSAASTLVVQLFQNKQQLIMIVEDNGKGMTSSNIEGHGLLNIKSRLNTIHGDVNYEPSGESGTIATVRVDLSSLT